MSKPISIYLTNEEKTDIRENGCDHSYLILLNDKLRKSQDDMTAEMKLMQTQISDLEYDSDRMEKTVQNMRGISKNFIELNKIQKILNNTERSYTRQLEAHSGYLRTQLHNNIKIMLIFMIIDILMCVLFAPLELISVEHMIHRIIQYSVITYGAYYTGYIKHIYDCTSPVDKRLLRIKNKFENDVTPIKLNIKKINKSVDFLNDLVDLM